MSTGKLVTKRADLETLTDILNRAEKLKKQIENLVDTLVKVYSSRGNLKPMVERIVREYELKPIEIDGSLVRNLEDYVRDMELYLKKLIRYADHLDKLSNGLDNMDKLASDLEAWANLVKDLNEYLYSEALKALSRYNAFLTKIGNLEVSEALSTAAVISDDLRMLTRNCRTLVLKRIREIRSSLGSLRSLAQIADRIAVLEDKEKVTRIKEWISETERKLDLIEQRAPYTDESLVGYGAKIREYMDFLKRVVSEMLSKEETRVLKEIGKIGRALDGRSIRFHELVELVSRYSGLSIDESMKIVYKLSKKNLVKVNVKLP
ncbi:MAG: hypothetical protein DRJ32_04270 [Thermoprotei archaeon]|nr:MAG: hypothetical protein DRJ32_04270 [Thermoprotei archaeon]HDD63763.1 hypothetical protein [Thermoprotei archaeon]